MRTLHTLAKTVAAATLLAGAAPAVAQPDPPSRVIVFGASPSDLGNAHDLLGVVPVCSGGSSDFPPSLPYDDGRFCNGPVWHEVAGAALGWPVAAPSVRGGDVWAYGAAVSGPGAEPSFPSFSTPIPSHAEQIRRFLDSNIIEDSDLIILGVNGDVLLEIFSAPYGLLPADSIQRVVANIEVLADAGASSLLVMNMPAANRMPLVLRGGADLVARADRLTDEYNALLVPALRSAAVAHHIELRIFDWDAAINAVCANPAAFGFTNATDPAQASGCVMDGIIIGGTPVPNPDTHVWWDMTHWTAATQQIVGQAVVDFLKCPVDFDASGSLDLFDFLAFQSAFAIGDLRADFDDDGVFTIFDFLAFQNAFAIGCD